MRKAARGLRADGRWFVHNAKLLAFNNRALASRTGRGHAVCLGDSHIRVFDHIARERLLRSVWLDVCPVDGATAQGLVNPLSKTNALPRFAERLARAPIWQSLIFQLGEVDCGFVIWYRARKHGLSIEEQLELSLSNYLSFLHDWRRKGFESIYVLSAPLPSIRDRREWGEIADLRREVEASQRERTALTVSYNERLSERCEVAGLTFLNLVPAEIDPSTGLLRESLRNRDPTDHHHAPDAYGCLVADALRPFFEPDGDESR